MARKNRDQPWGPLHERGDVSHRLLTHNQIRAYLEDLYTRGLLLERLPRVARRLRRMGPEVWKVLARQLRSEDSELARLGAMLAAEMDGEEAIDLLYGALEDPLVTDQVKLYAAFLLHELGSPIEWEYLAEVIGDPEAALAETTESILAMLEDPRGLEAFCLSLESLPPEIKIGAILMLGANGDTRAVEPLALLVDDEEKEVVLAAIEALSRIPSPRALDPLTRAAQEAAAPEVRRAAQKALIKVRTELVDHPPLPTPETEAAITGSYVSSVDGVGSFFVVLVAHYPHHGDRFGAYCLNVERGVVDCFGGEFNEELFHYLRERTTREVNLFVGGLTWYGLEAIREAEARTPRRQWPPEYAFHRRLLDCQWDETGGAVERAEFEALWEKAREARPTWLEESADLLEDPEFASWLMDPERLGGFIQDALDLFRRYHHPQHPDYQAGLGDLVTKVLETRFGDREQAMLDRMLQHQCHVEWGACHEEEATILAAVAHSLKAGAVPFAEHPFLRAYVRRSLELSVLIHTSDVALPSGVGAPTRRSWWARRRTRR